MWYSMIESWSSIIVPLDRRAGIATNLVAPVSRYLLQQLLLDCQAFWPGPGTGFFLQSTAARFALHAWFVGLREVVLERRPA